MANKKRTEIDIKIGAKKFVLRATYEVIASIETELDRSVLSLLDSFGEGDIKLSEATCVVYHALQPKHSDEFEIGGRFEDTDTATGRARLSQDLFEMGILEYVLPISTLISIAITGNRPASKSGAATGKK